MILTDYSLYQEYIIEEAICYSYTMVTRDLSQKTTDPEGEVWFSLINPRLP